MNNNQALEALASLASVVPVNGETATETASSGSPKLEAAKAEDSNASDASTSTAPSVGVTNQVPAAALLQQVPGLSAQQLQSLLASANGLQRSPVAAAPAGTPTNAQNLALLASLQQMTQQQQPAANILDLQKMGYLQLLAQQQNAQQMAAPGIVPASPIDNAAKMLSLALTGQQQQQAIAPLLGQDNRLPVAAKSSAVMPPSVAQVSSAAVAPSGTQHIAPQPPRMDSGDDATTIDYEHQIADKKQQKRAANRRSAQLSRKRKKQFIEELKDENDCLRRKEQILKSIPDLVVVFDSSGKLWFVSQSVSTFLNFNSEELEGTSFWSRLCDNSVRLLKAAFMDSLAARQADSETAPLGTGFWELRLVDKDGSHKVVTLNGVVHFAGDRPECVCSIRPQAQQSDSSSGTAASTRVGDKPLVPVDPRQSVVSKAEDNPLVSSKQQAMRISDSGNSSGTSSESGSSDELGVSA